MFLYVILHKVKVVNLELKQKGWYRMTCFFMRICRIFYFSILSHKVNIKAKISL